MGACGHVRGVSRCVRARSCVRKHARAHVGVRAFAWMHVPWRARARARARVEFKFLWVSVCVCSSGRGKIPPEESLEGLRVGWVPEGGARRTMYSRIR